MLDHMISTPWYQACTPAYPQRKEDINEEDSLMCEDFTVISVSSRSFRQGKR